MVKQLSPEEREEIKQSSKTYREIAREKNISVATVARWKNRQDVGRAKKNTGRISEFEKALFRECFRVTRYPCQTLIEFLAPVWKKLPSSYILEKLSNFKKIQKSKEKEESNAHQRGTAHFSWKEINYRGKKVKMCVPYSLITMSRILEKALEEEEREEKETKRLYEGKEEKYEKEENFCEVDDIGCSKKATLVIHSVKVVWSQKERVGNCSVNGEALCLFERKTGIVYIKIFRGSLSEANVASSVCKFLEMCPIEIKTVRPLRFFTETKKGEWRSTALQYRENGVLEVIKKCFKEEPKVKFDNHTLPKQFDRIVLPKLYKNKLELDKEIVNLVNRYNKFKRVLGGLTGR